MAGRQNGLQAKILSENSKAIYLYCFDHQLNLVVQESLNGITKVSLALERMNGVVNSLGIHQKVGPIQYNFGSD